jgi:secernin
MCDAWVAQKDVTRNRTVLFAKNSDRPSGECQVLYCGSPRKPNGKRAVRCSYVEVEDDAGALATIGCRPYWCWGYETGLNEAGVVGGNTAIFTRSLHLKEESKPLGLTGMDLLRFGLERGDTAEKAVEAIIDLLSRFGQWGSAVQGKDHDEGSYENAFLVADGKESWILETSGRRWIARQANNGFLALSNQPTIRDEWTNTSPNLQDFAADMGWWRPETGAFDFARDFGDHEHYSRQVSHIRWRRVVQLLDTARGNIDVPWMMRMLRDHLEGTFLCGPQFHPFLPDFHTICMHDSPAGFTWGNTATSVIIEIDPSRHLPPRLWIAYQSVSMSVSPGPTLSRSCSRAPGKRTSMSVRLVRLRRMNLSHCRSGGVSTVLFELSARRRPRAIQK